MSKKQTNQNRDLSYRASPYLLPQQARIMSLEQDWFQEHAGYVYIQYQIYATFGFQLSDFLRITQNFFF